MYGMKFDTQQIRKMIKEFYSLTGIIFHFSSHDLNVRINCNDNAFENNKSKFCTILRGDINAKQQCERCDKNAYIKSCNEKKTYIYKCHAGLTEVIAPIILDNKFLGYVITGKILDRVPTKSLWNLMKDNFNKYDIDMIQLEKAFYKLSYMNLEKIKSASYILDMCSKYIYMSSYAKIIEPGRKQCIINYINANLSKRVSITSLSSFMNLSISYLSNIIKTDLGCSFTEYLNKMRVEKAKELLKLSNLKLEDIALECGFSNQNYFTRVFKRYTGQTPFKFKQN